MPAGVPNTFEPIAPLISHLLPAEQDMPFPSSFPPFPNIMDIIHSGGIWMRECCIPDVNEQFLHLPSAPLLPWMPQVTMLRNGPGPSNRGTQNSKPSSYSQRSPGAPPKESSSRSQARTSNTSAPTDSKPQPSLSTSNKPSRGENPSFIGPDPNAEWTIYHECPPSMRNMGFEGASNFAILGGNWGIHHGSVNYYTAFRDGKVVRSRTESDGRRKQRRRGSK